MVKRQRGSDDERLPPTPAKRRPPRRSPSSTGETPGLSSGGASAGSSTAPSLSISTASSPRAPTETGPPENRSCPMEDSSEGEIALPCGSGAGSPNYELPASHQLIAKLPVTIVVKFGSEQHTTEITITPSSEESYHQIEMVADNLAKGNVPTRIQFHKGDCVIPATNTKREKALPFQSRHDWPTVQKKLGRRRGDVGYGPEESLRLTVTRTYEQSRQPAVAKPAGQMRSNMLCSDLKDRIKRPNAEKEGNQLYISKDDLDKLMSRETIECIVQEDDDIKIEEKEYLSARIYYQARKLLALFVYARHRLSSLKLLLDDCYNDGSLPFKECPDLLGETYENLLTLQWIFLAPVFTGKHLELSADVVIPTISSVYCARGSHSNVYKIRIEPSHLEIDGLEKVPNPELALKVLKVHHDPKFPNECSVLEVLRELRHEHIVRLLCTYKYNDTYNMLFPLAECDLRTYMKRAPPELTKDAVVWFLSQLIGLADALCKIHNYKSSSETSKPQSLPGYSPDEDHAIYHHDLKPENILYFGVTVETNPGNKLGSLQISDFGLAKIHPNNFSSSAATSTSGTATYAPPEADLNPSRLGRRYDIWSMGCIFLELLVWFCFGPNGCEEFNESRRPVSNRPYRDDAFYDINESGAELRPGVKEWIGRLRGHSICKGPGGLAATVTLVEDEMLHVDPNVRGKPNRYTKKLHQFLEEVREIHQDPLQQENAADGLARPSPSQGGYDHGGAVGQVETFQPLPANRGTPAIVLPIDEPEASHIAATAAESRQLPGEQERNQGLLSAPPASRRSGRRR